ncbi:hypothetical protein MY04_1812 [Flammeovirga sp. MY04]|uniref:hypothetical protein n=1 Tax=Flammeovirga sp. MY04 TaxID=1191459 RepID=UPI0008064292|nr:hypothetical protein [Flammeovirga sp. MY04]ANQ49186.1 hypothetical protein MY04_1812 [Flammeovirga sp. MY04]
MNYFNLKHLVFLLLISAFSFSCSKEKSDKVNLNGVWRLTNIKVNLKSFAEDMPPMEKKMRAQFFEGMFENTIKENYNILVFENDSLLTNYRRPTNIDPDDYMQYKKEYLKDFSEPYKILKKEGKFYFKVGENIHQPRIITLSSDELVIENFNDNITYQYFEKVSDEI